MTHEALLATVAELDRRGWTTKRWTTMAGKHRNGKPFNKTSLYALLTNITYMEMMRY